MKLAKSFEIGIYYGKHGSGVVVSECKKCKALSWIHMRLDSVEYVDEFPKAWKTKAKKELAKRELQALREWGSSLCWNCKKLKSGKVTTSTFRTCEIGLGPAQKECSAYKPC